MGIGDDEILIITLNKNQTLHTNFIISTLHVSPIWLTVESAEFFYYDKHR